MTLDAKSWIFLNNNPLEIDRLVLTALVRAKGVGHNTLCYSKRRFVKYIRVFVAKARIREVVIENWLEKF